MKVKGVTIDKLKKEKLCSLLRERKIWDARRKNEVNKADVMQTRGGKRR